MKKKVIILFLVIFLAIFVFLLFLIKNESLENSQKNNQDTKQLISLNSIKQRESKVESQKLKVLENKKNNREIKEKSEESEESEEKESENINDKKFSLRQNLPLGDSDVLEYYKVIRIIDGDTIVVDIGGINEVVRLIGINTPETKDPRKVVECFGVEASNKANELLGDKSVFLEKDATQAERDKYNRILRYAKIKDGLFYNLEIIKQGYAYEYTYIIPYKYQSEFKEAENYARINKLGLWADDACSSFVIPVKTGI